MLAPQRASAGAELGRSRPWRCLLVQVIDSAFPRMLFGGGGLGFEMIGSRGQEFTKRGHTHTFSQPKPNVDRFLRNL
jgi:hypothetical protein